jgi:PAS domain S-box-containing protein
VLALATVYFAAAKLGLSLAFVAEQVSAVWPPTGIALAAVLLLGYRVWPGIALGAFLANATANESVATALGIATGNTLEALTGAWLLQNAIAFSTRLERVKDALGFILLAVGLSTTVSATIGVTSLCLGGVQPWHAFASVWWIWWLGDAMGGLVVAPVLLTWAPGNFHWPERHIGETVALAAGLTATSLAIFVSRWTVDLGGFSFGYAVFPFVVWAALRFGQQGTTAVILLVSAVAISGTVRGLGPFGPGPLHERLLFLQIFMSVLASTALLLGAALTERRLAADTLRQSEGRLKAVLDNSPAVIYVKDLEGRLLLINQEFCNLRQQRLEDLIGKSDYELFPKETADVLRAHDQEVIKRNAPMTAEEIVSYHGQSHVYVSVKFPLYDLRGVPYALCGISTDISERKRMEETLRQQTEALEEADRRKDEFLALLGHELRNPLAPILNAVQVMGWKGPDDTDHDWAREVIERQVQVMSRLVDDLLDVSRITRGKILLQIQPTDLASLVTNALEVSRPLIEARKHKLTVVLPDEAIWLKADPVRLTQVLSNLMNNAAKYTEEGGQIWVVAEPGPTSRLAAREVLIRVKDTGIGIEPAMLPKVFDPFTQIDKTGHRAEGGLGIGLTLVRRLVEMHGGKVQASSEGRGKGSEFIVRLPILQERPGSDRTTPARVGGKPGSTRRILVIDDNRDAAETLAKLLRLIGHEVRTAHDGLLGLATARSYCPEVVLLDIGLPGMDGLEVARRLRSEPGMKDALLVAISGYGQEADLLRSLEAGFNHHLVKPVNFDALQTILTRGNGRGDRRTSHA